MIFGKRIFFVPTWSIVAFVLFYVGAEIAQFYYFLREFDFDLQTIMRLDISELTSRTGPFSLTIVSCCALAYGVFRSTYFHPLFSVDYVLSLSSMPWSLDKPLPKGTPFVAWQDAFILAVLCLLSLRAESYHWMSVVLILAAIGYSLPPGRNFRCSGKYFPFKGLAGDRLIVVSPMVQGISCEGR